MHRATPRPVPTPRMWSKVTLAVLLVVTLPVVAVADDDAFSFLGITPGVTTARQLAMHQRWGKPKERQQTEEGSVRLQYQLRGYNQVDVLLRGNVVQTIDVALSVGLTPATVASVMKLGEPTVGEAVTDAEKLGKQTPAGWEGVRYSAGRVLLFSDAEGKAKRMRVFAGHILPTKNVTVPPAPDDPVSAPNDVAAETAAWKVTGPTEAGRKTALAFARMLPQHHLSRHPIDDEIASRTLRLFVRSLDPQRIYFNQPDIDSFRDKADTFDDRLKKGDLTFAYQIFQTFRQRVEARRQLSDVLFDGDHDFTIDEEWVSVDDSDAFPENELEFHEIWRKRVKYQLLVHMAAGEDLKNARKLARRVFHNMHGAWRTQTDQDLVARLLTAVSNAYDPHSTFISQQTYDDFVISTRQALMGIGAALQMVDGYVQVSNIIPGGPADKDSRLKPGDRILAVAQGDDGPFVDAVGKLLRETVALMRGPKDTVLRLRVLPKGEFETQVYSITRDRVELARSGSTVLTSEHLSSEGDVKVGFIYLPSFYGEFVTNNETVKRACSADVQRILERFKEEGVSLVVLDLRNNSGGLLREALEVVALFTGPGVTVQAKGGDGNVQNWAAQHTKQAVWDGPLSVLIGRSTASGAEIVSAALQDYRAGMVIGETTNGNATMQNVTDLGQAEEAGKLGYINCTTSRVYRVTGDTFQRTGVTPDVIVPSQYAGLAAGEATLKYALKANKISAVPFETLGRAVGEKVLKRLAARSLARREKSEFFQLQTASSEAAGTAATISLNKEKFLASQTGEEDVAKAVPELPGISDVKFDGYLKELLNVSLSYYSQRRFDDAESRLKNRSIGQAIEQYRLAVAADPTNDIAHYKLAWVLSTNSSARVRDGQAAVKHAMAACEVDGYDKWSYLLCLAIAEAEAGDFENAKKHLATALTKAPEKQRETFEFLTGRFEREQSFSR